MVGKKSRRKEFPSNSNSSGRMGQPALSGMSTDGDGADSSSAPAQRSEVAEQGRAQSVRLATFFFMNILFGAPPGLRSEAPGWVDHLEVSCRNFCIDFECCRTN